MVMFKSFILDQKNSVWANYLSKIKVVAYTNWNVLNLIVTFICSALDMKYPFPANLTQEIKIFCLRWNLVPRLIQIYWIRWWCSHFFLGPKIPSLGKFSPKIQNGLLKVKFGIKTNSNLSNLMMMFITFVLEILVPNFQSCYKILFKLFNLIVARVCFDKLVNIHENSSARNASCLI